MAIAPLIVGCWFGGFQATHLLLVPAWLAAFVFYQDLQGAMRAPDNRRRRYATPIIVYGAVALACTVPLLVLRPALWWWAPAFAVLVAVSAVCVARKAVRSLLNDLATQAAACLMVGVGFEVGTGPVGAFTWIGVWTATVFLFLYFAGTSFYVKTVIRERGRPRWYAASLVYHGVVLVVVGAWAFAVTDDGLAPFGWTMAAVAAVMLARAAVVPRLPGVTPPRVGFGEVGLTVVVVAAIMVVFA